MTATAPDHDQRGAARTALFAALMVIASFIAGKAARDAILLSNFDITMLPLFVGISAVVSFPLVLFAGRLMERIGPQRLMPALNLMSAILLVVEWLLLARQPRVAAVMCFFHLGSLGAVLVSGFWSIINERFDARSAKRHIGRIGLGATIGGIVGGVVAERSAVYLEPGAILLVLAGLQLACAILMRLLAGPDPGVHDVDTIPRGQAWSAMGVIRRSSLLRNLAFVIVLGAIGAAALDYVFKAQLTRSAGPGGPLRFLAIYHTATNVITALVQVALSRIVVTRFGVARSVGVLPATLTGFGLGALIIPGVWSIVIARAAEMVARSSIYRAAYELIYAPLAEHDKRSTKVILDVGAERVGDLIGSQLVAVLLFAIPLAQPWLLGVAVAAGFGAMVFAVLLPRAYTASLEASLLTHAEGTPGADQRPEASMMWSTLGRPTLADAGDMTAMSLLDLRAVGPPPGLTFRHPALADMRKTQDPEARVREHVPAPEPPPVDRDPIADAVAVLRSGDATRVRRALAGRLRPELAAHVVPLIGWDAVAQAAVRALRGVAPRCTGVLVDTLLDQTQEFTIRRRLPAILVAGEPELARWALWRAMSDPRFEVRYRCSRALARIHAATHREHENLAEVLAVVKKELSVGSEVWRSHRLLDGTDAADSQTGAHVSDDAATVTDDLAASTDQDATALRQILRQRSATGLDHVFTLLGLALPAEPVRIAFQGLFTDDRGLRATALEYLESVLPPDVRALLWPLIDADGMPLVAPRPAHEVAQALLLSHPNIVANLRQVAGRR